MTDDYDGELRMVVCPLGSACLADGPTCFEVADALESAVDSETDNAD